MHQQGKFSFLSNLSNKIFGGVESNHQPQRQLNSRDYVSDDEDPIEHMEEQPPIPEPPRRQFFFDGTLAANGHAFSRYTCKSVASTGTHKPEGNIDSFKSHNEPDSKIQDKKLITQFYKRPATTSHDVQLSTSKDINAELEVPAGKRVRLSGNINSKPLLEPRPLYKPKKPNANLPFFPRLASPSLLETTSAANKNLDTLPNTSISMKQKIHLQRISPETKSEFETLMKLNTPLRNARRDSHFLPSFPSLQKNDFKLNKPDRTVSMRTLSGNSFSQDTSSALSRQPIVYGQSRQKSRFALATSRSHLTRPYERKQITSAAAKHSIVKLSDGSRKSNIFKMIDSDEEYDVADISTMKKVSALPVVGPIDVDFLRRNKSLDFSFRTTRNVHSFAKMPINLNLDSKYEVKGEVKSVSPQPEQIKRTNWSCKKCTTINNSLRKTCQSCQANISDPVNPTVLPPKPTKSEFKIPIQTSFKKKEEKTREISTSTTTLPLAQDKTAIDPSLIKEPWICPACFKSNGVELTNCRSCGILHHDLSVKQIRENKEKEAEKSKSEDRIATGSLNSVVPALNSSSGKRWACPKCNVFNDDEKEKCSCCSTNKPGIKPIADTTLITAFATGKNKWTCPTCMVHNDHDKIKCPCCETPNPKLPPTAETTAEKRSCPNCNNNDPDKQCVCTTATNSAATTIKPGLKATSITSAPSTFKFGLVDPAPIAPTSISTTTTGFGFGLKAPNAEAKNAPISFGFKPAAVSTTTALTTDSNSNDKFPSKQTNPTTSVTFNPPVTTSSTTSFSFASNLNKSSNDSNKATDTTTSKVPGIFKAAAPTTCTAFKSSQFSAAQQISNATTSASLFSGSATPIQQWVPNTTGKIGASSATDSVAVPTMPFTFGKPPATTPAETAITTTAASIPLFSFAKPVSTTGLTFPQSSTVDSSNISSGFFTYKSGAATTENASSIKKPGPGFASLNSNESASKAFGGANAFSTFATASQKNEGKPVFSGFGAPAVNGGSAAGVAASPMDAAVNDKPSFVFGQANSNDNTTGKPKTTAPIFEFNPTTAIPKVSTAPSGISSFASSFAKNQGSALNANNPFGTTTPATTGVSIFGTPSTTTVPPVTSNSFNPSSQLPSSFSFNNQESVATGGSSFNFAMKSQTTENQAAPVPTSFVFGAGNTGAATSQPAKLPTKTRQVLIARRRMNR